MISEGIPNLRYFIDGLTPFGLISKSLSKSQKSGGDQHSLAKSVDIMGIVVQFEETKLVWVDNKQNRVQLFTFVDMEKVLNSYPKFYYY
ncbi:hypothetical protein Leryth_021203 [Lithospermum erythrorhizon]|nr:hypothetical protein Leryth_021203 [Lithospermum erythrorhizon]